MIIKIKKIVLVGILMLTLPITAFLGADETKVEILTFEQAVSLALKHNYQIEMARNSTTIAKNNAHIGNAGLLPSLDASGSLVYADPKGTTPSDWDTDYSISASYTLFDGFGNIYRFKRLQGTEELTRLQARNQIEETLISVSEAYYTTASAAENLSIANDLLDISKQRLERAEKKAQYGQANSVEVLSARVDYNNDRVTVAEAELNWRESKRNLNTFLNRDISYPFNIEANVVFAPINSLDELKESALGQNATYLASLQEVRQSLLDLRLAGADYFPKLNLSASYGDSSGWKVSAGLNWNLFDGFQKNIARKNARISLENSRLSQEQTKLEITKEVVNAYETYQHSQLILKLEEENLQAAQINFQRIRELYNLGQVTTTQFREAQLNLIQSKSNISNARYTAKIKELILLRLTGKLITK